ncbi:MAG: hypothetical protein RI885_2017 [Actinomycetota bacterium]
MSLAFAVPPFTLWHDELWDTILDLSALLDTGSWALIGGQAVVAHALTLDDSETALLRDVDPVGGIATTVDSLPTVERSFRYLGFAPIASTAPGFHFRREAEGPAPDQLPQTWAVHAIGVTEWEGADQAYARRLPFQATKGLRAPWVPVPDLLSTIVYEAARFSADVEQPFLHARQAAYLVSLLNDPTGEAARLTPSDRRALRCLDAAVGRPDHHAWDELPSHRDAYSRWRSLLEG